MDNASDEDGEEELILPCADSGYLPLAERCEGVTWIADGWTELETLFTTLDLLQEISSHEPDWDELLKDLVVLQPLRFFDCPSSDFTVFNELGDLFLNIHHSTEWGVADYLYFDEDAVKQKQVFLRECAELTRRFRGYEPLRDFWQYIPD